MTPGSGRVGVLVKGAFRPKNSYQGPIDLLVRCRVTLQLLAGRELGYLTARQVHTSYPRLRQSLRRFRAADHLLRVVLGAVPVGHGEAETFRLLDRALAALEELPVERVELLRLSFDLHFLRQLGLEPQLWQCVSCGEGRDLGSFQAAAGGLLCRRCRDPGSDLIPVRRDVRELLQSLASRRLSEIAAAPAGVTERAARLLDSHLIFHLDYRPAFFIRPETS